MLQKLRKGLALSLLCVLGLFIGIAMWPDQIPDGAISNPNEAPADRTPVEDADHPYNYPNPKEEKLDVTLFHHFDSSRTYQAKSALAREITHQEDLLVSEVKNVALDYLKKKGKDSTFVSGRYRWIAEGVEYDLSFRDSSKGSTNRVILLQKLETPEVVRSLQSTDKMVVNIIITLQGRLDKYAIFLDHLVSNVLSSDSNLSLTVVYFSDSKLEEAQELTSRMLSSHPKFQWNFIHLEEESFSRGRGLHIGAQSLKSSGTGTGNPATASKILFFCDVDILMQPDFFQRCRSSAVEGHQVYYPIVFSMYNPHLVYPLFDKKIPSLSEQLVVTDQSGFWREFGYGMACMYMSDYESAGGFPDLKTWGAEDDALQETFLNMDYMKVLRSPDPSLFHLYHPKECLKEDRGEVTTRASTYPSCLKSKALTEGSQLQLGLTLLRLQEGVDVEGILSKSYYYFWLVPYLVCFLFLSLVSNILQATAAITSSGNRVRIPYVYNNTANNTNKFQ